MTLVLLYIILMIYNETKICRPLLIKIKNDFSKIWPIVCKNIYNILWLLFINYYVSWKEKEDFSKQNTDRCETNDFPRLGFKIIQSVIKLSYYHYKKINDHVSLIYVIEFAELNT